MSCESLSAWCGWLASAWPRLASGEHVSVPPVLPHPSVMGFEHPPMAEPAGQVTDWVLSLSDGSRLHVHEYAGNKLIAHRDRVDPKRGPLHAAWHWATESTSGRVVLGAMTVYQIVRWLL
jgi:hypothetical protein